MTFFDTAIRGALKPGQKRGLSGLALAAAAAMGLALTGAATTAQAAGEGAGVIDHDFKHEGLFGAFDAAQLRRGWQIYQEVCAGCHSMKQLSYRNLGDPNGPAFSEADVRAIAAEFSVVTIDEAGDEVERPATPADKMVAPFANDEAAKASNGGALPPDLSLITKSRAGYHGIIKQLTDGFGGPEYVYSLMQGYTDEPPEGFEVGNLNYNKYFSGHKIAMGPQLSDGFEYVDPDAPEGTVEQQAEDIAAFLTWAAEPDLVERKQAGVRNILFLGVLAVLVWYSNRKLWAPVKKGAKA